jgi:hypothetical protein
MAWRPTQYLLDGVLDNTNPGKVTGWMRFAGMSERVTCDLDGDFHREIRGAKIRFQGDGEGADDGKEAREYMEGFAQAHTGNVGDITAGRAPFDYGTSPYIEWYGNENGRVVLELEPVQLEVIGQPIPAIESDPISREQQQRNMAGFLSGISQAMQAPAIAVGTDPGIASDPKFSHWVVESGQIVGEARNVETFDDRMSFAVVRLYSMPEMAEHGRIASNQLLAKEL